jgi:protein arginine N-methyltransferase 5
MVVMCKLNDSVFECRVIVVAGAGRGPLVMRSLQAAKVKRINVHIYALEENVFAFHSLTKIKKNDWALEPVTIIHCDMRQWDAPEQADVIVSELLGSFGDNDLAPECLDGVQKFLRPGGIMIPQSYSSYVAPIMSPKIWYQAHCNKPRYPTGDLKCYESPYVVHMKNCYVFSHPAELFTFEHPKPGNY